MKKLLLPLLFSLTLLTTSAQEPDSLEFLEAFAWGDRQAALAMLVPNTEEFYYFHSLHYQLASDRAALEQTQRDWRQFLGRRSLTPRYREIRLRQHLLDFNRNPELTWDRIKDDLNLHFNHRRHDESRESTAPSTVDPASYSFATFQREAHRGNAFPRYSTRGLERLDPSSLSPEHRRVLLSRIDRPDFPGLVDLLLQDLHNQDTQGFGSLGIHNLLSKAQLDELARRRPDLLRQGAFVTQRLARIPAPDTDLSHDHEAAVEHFTELWHFVRNLEPMHNSLKASVAYRLMHHQRHLGVYDEELFRAYLDLPRRVHYLPRERLETLQRRNTDWVDFNYRPGNNIVLPPIIDESPLVREFLLHLFRTANSPDTFQTWFEADWLDALFAESKILHGIGRPEDQAPRLSPAHYRAILDRVELDFAHLNPSYIPHGEPVELKVDLKRVDQVLIKIYELQTFNYYTTRRQPVDQSVELDGLVATHQRTLDTPAPPGRRVRHTLAFPEITQRGVYVVELIGGGVSSRALLHIGSLEAVSHPTASGQAVMVLNDAGEHIQNASLWIDGREFDANDNGIILLPYSENPGTRFTVLRHGSFSHPEQLHHFGENYAFSAGIHLDPQNLPRRKSGLLLLRPDFRVNGIPLDPARLGDVTVTLASTDAQDTRTEREFTAEFTSAREWAREFYVPDDLRTLHVTVTAKLRRRTDREEITLRDAHTLNLNAARTEDTLRQIFLLSTADGWRLEVRGLNGEPITNLPLNLTFHHPAFTTHTRTPVTTDDHGRVHLGPLTDLSRIQANGPDNLSLNQPLPAAATLLPKRLHLQENEPLSLAYPHHDPEGLTPATLLRRDRGAVQEILTDRINIAEGELSIDGLPAGEYQLRLHETSESITLLVGEGDLSLGYIFGPGLRLQETIASTPSLRNLSRQNNTLRIDLRNPTPSTRVAVRAARYAGPGAEIPTGFGFPSPLQRTVFPPHMQYVSGRNIGDEYRYVLDRQGLEIFAGTLLDRPTLILNPWELRETTAERELLKADEAYRRARQRMAAPARGVAPDFLREYTGRPTESIIPSPHDIGFDFLPQGSRWWLNLSPDQNGIIEIPLDDLHEQTHLDILILDRFGTSRSRHPLPDSNFDPRDVRLLAGLDPQQSFSRQKHIRPIPPNEPLTFPDLATTRYQAIRTFGQAYDLLRTLGGHDHLADFNFLKEWPQLDDDTQRAKYGEFASHEMHLFLHARDPEFFNEVVRPYLDNKKDKTLVDRWLLDQLTDEDLRLDRLQNRNALELALLARRGGDRSAIQAALRERVELLPPDPEGFARLVRVALQSADLDETIAAVRQDARERAEAESTVLRRAQELRMPAAARMADADHFAPPPEEAAPVPEPAIRSPRDRAMSLREEAADDAHAPFAYDGLDLAEMDFDDVQELFRALPKTKEWAEQNYYNLRVRDDLPERIPPSEFWRDLADGQPLSAHLLHAHTSLTEVLVALAFSDLPWDVDDDLTEDVDGPALSLSSPAPALLVSEQILPAEDADDDRPLLISQQFFRPDDRYRYEGNEQIEKFITGEFIRRTVYGARVTLTNPTANPRRLNVLMQIPQGAIPVKNGFYTDDQSLRLNPYTTQTIEFHFYFPFSGEFPQFPPHAAAEEKIIGRTEPHTFHVVDAPTEIDRTSWDWISQNADIDQLFDFLDQSNLRRLDLDLMAWRLRDRDVFTRATDLLASRLLFHDTTFSYSVYHQDPQRARIWLPRSPLADRVGPVLDSPLLSVDPVQRKTYEHLEYDPLVNPRAHPVGETRKILNPAVNQQYRAFLATAAYRHQLDPNQSLGLVHYLLLQDRLAEARDQLANLPKAHLHEQIQFQYLQAWMALRTLDLDRALALTSPHIQHPVPRWRNRFSSLHDAILEARGDSPADPQDPDRQQRLDRAADRAPALEMKLDAGRVLVHAHNLPRATLNLYPMDIELLFSRRPFQTDGGDGFGIVKPALSRVIDLPDHGEEFELELPPEFRDQNLVVELTARGLRESVARHANKLRVRIIQSFGQLEVRSSESGDLLPKTYIKVYAQGIDGRESFWKDGYTDLRGRFDYLSLNDREPEEAVRFSILILHPQLGATIRQTSPPTR